MSSKPNLHSLAEPFLQLACSVFFFIAWRGVLKASDVATIFLLWEHLSIWIEALHWGWPDSSTSTGCLWNESTNIGHISIHLWTTHFSLQESNLYMKDGTLLCVDTNNAFIYWLLGVWIHFHKASSTEIVTHRILFFPCILHLMGLWFWAAVWTINPQIDE